MDRKIPTIDRDYTYEPVPQQDRLPALQVFSIWTGFILVVGIMAVGGGLAGQLSRHDFFIAILLGNLILAGFAAYTGYIGAKTGRAFNQLVTGAFPGVSSKIANLYVPLVLIGWYAVESALFGSFVGHAFNLSPMAERIVMVISALCFAISSYVGFRGLKWVSFVMVPIILGLGSYSIIAVLNQNNLTFGFDKGITLPTGLSIVIGSWIMGVLTSLPDLTRFCRKPIYGAVVGGVGIFVANLFNLVIGGYGASLSKQSDPAVILTSLGLIFAGLAFSLANIWTTNDSNMYSASLNLASATRHSRRNCVLLCTGIGILLTIFNPARLAFIFSFLIFMGNTAPALAGVVYTSSFLQNRTGINRNPFIPWLAWCIGSIASWLAGGLWSLPLGLLTATIFVLICSKFNKTQTPETAQNDESKTRPMSGGLVR
jgi:cytosine permease